MFRQDLSHDSTRSDRGSAIVTTLMLVLVVTALGGTLLMTMNTEHLISANERDAERALHAAKAGLSDAYFRFLNETLSPSDAGTPFASDETPGSNYDLAMTPSRYDGRLFDHSAIAGRGQVYRIEATGYHRRARRTIEMVFQINADAFRFGFLAFSNVNLHNHAMADTSFFRIESTIFANNAIGVPEELTIDGSLVSPGSISTNPTSTVNGDLYGNSIDHAGTLNGNARRVNAIETAADPVSPDVTDRAGRPYDWYNGRDSPGPLTGGGTISGTSDQIDVTDGDEFRYSLWSANGALLPDPDLNVVRYIPPPLLDYADMYAESQLFDDTYMDADEFYQYIRDQAAIEVQGVEAADDPATCTDTLDNDGDGLTDTDDESCYELLISRVGSQDEPEFFYLTEAISLEVTGAGGGNTGGQVAVDGVWIEGGMYTPGSFSYNGFDFDPAIHPDGFENFRINALPHCYPALIAYAEPAGGGNPEDWEPDQTPALGGSDITYSGSDEGFSWINGLTFSQGTTHMHHTNDEDDLIRFNGAELGETVHNCNYFQFTYDPRVSCTRFLISGVGDPLTISYREL